MFYIKRSKKRFHQWDIVHVCIPASIPVVVSCVRNNISGTATLCNGERDYSAYERKIVLQIAVIRGRNNYVEPTTRACCY